MEEKNIAALEASSNRVLVLAFFACLIAVVIMINTQDRNWITGRWLVGTFFGLCVVLIVSFLRKSYRLSKLRGISINRD